MTLALIPHTLKRAERGGGDGLELTILITGVGGDRYVLHGDLHTVLGGAVGRDGEDLVGSYATDKSGGELYNGFILQIEQKTNIFFENIFLLLFDRNFEMSWCSYGFY